MLARLAVTVVLVIAVGRVARAHEDHYPMASAEYRKKATVRLERYRERIEAHMTAQHFADAKRAAVRTRLTSLETALRDRLEKLAGDGTITKAEADDLKRLGKDGRAAIYKDFGIEDDAKPNRDAKPAPRR